MELGTFEAKHRLSAFDEVARGGEVTITRRGKPIARLVPVQLGPDRDTAQRAAATILARSKGVTLGGIGLKELVNDAGAGRSLPADDLRAAYLELAMRRHLPLASLNQPLRNAASVASVPLVGITV